MIKKFAICLKIKYFFIDNLLFQIDLNNYIINTFYNFKN